ncbi:MAG: AAA family ATPase [Spirochaetia bacterium]|nr:AAA family ATPase [Spirochaetia bacterium]
MRRCGKSTLLSQLFYSYLLEQGTETRQIILINLESLENEELLDYHQLYTFIKSRLVSGKMNYIIIDEIQNCKGFERVIDSLYLLSNTDIYITGSNAYLLSSDLATMLTGRYVILHLLPFSFSEYQCFFLIRRKGNCSMHISRREDFLSVRNCLRRI